MSLIGELEARISELPDGLEGHVEAELAIVRERWPQGPVPGAAFADYLAARMSARPRVADLYLAWWTSTGASEALAAFTARFDDDLRRAAARFRDHGSDELRQLLHIKLFVGSAPKILDYTGSGTLQSWLRVTAVRAFVDAVRATRSRGYERELDEDELLGIADPKAIAISAELGAAVKRAFADAVAGLAPRQRVFLRHVYVDRHTLEQIATHYSMHRATVARTLASARAQLIEQTRARVSAIAGISADDLSSVVRALDSRVELSLSRVLAPAEL